MQTVSPRVSLTPIGGYTPQQPVAHAPSLTQPSAFIDVEKAIGREPHTSQTEQAQSALGVGQEKLPFAEAGMGGKVSATREALNAAGADALYAASETRAGKSAKNHWLGWAVLAFVVLIGIFSISAAKRSGERKIEAMRAVANVPPAPRQPTAEEMKQAAIDARWREAADYNARLEARQRAEAEAQRRSAEAFERALTRMNNEMNSSVPQTQPDSSAMQRQQDQQMHDMQTRADQMKSQQEQQMQELKQQQEKAQREAEKNKPVLWRCTRCGQELTRPRGQEPSVWAGGVCIERTTGEKHSMHNYDSHY